MDIRGTGNHKETTSFILLGMADMSAAFFTALIYFSVSLSDLSDSGSCDLRCDIESARVTVYRLYFLHFRPDLSYLCRITQTSFYLFTYLMDPA